MVSELLTKDPAPASPPRLGRHVRDLAVVSSKVVAFNVTYLAGVWAVIIAAVTLAALRPTWWTLALAFVVVSGRQQALLNVEHECIHGIFLKGRNANERVAVALCASPVGSPYNTSKARHLAHHRTLAQPEDPDHDLHAGPDKSTRGGVLRHFALGLLGGYALRILLGRHGGDGPAVVSRRDTLRDLRNLVIGQATLFAAAALLLEWWVYPVLWAAPLGTLTAFCHLVRSFGEHALVADEEAGHANRLITVRSNRVERFLVAPYNMNYHSEHHLFPWIPASRLPEAQRRLHDAPEAPPRLVRSSYAQALGSYFRSLAA